ncbi:MAG: DUF748 domain-containing protein [Usitatibacter sp.]
MDTTVPAAGRKIAPPSRTARRWCRAVVAVVGGLALYGLVVGFLVPPIARKVAADKLGERLGRVVAIDDVSIHPYTLSVRVKGFRILEADARTEFVSFDTLDLDVSAASLYRLAPVVDELTLAGLRIRLVRDGESHFNLSDILERLAKAAGQAPRTDAKDEPRFSIGNIRVVNAAVDFDDRPKGAKHQVTDVNFSIPFISSLPTNLKDYVKPAFSANVNGAPVRLTGETQPFENSLRTHFNLDLKAVDLRRYLEYVPVALPVMIDSGRLDARISVRFTQSSGKQPSVDIAGTVAFRELALSSADGRLAQLGLVEADVASLDPIGATARVTSIRVGDATAMGGEWRISAAEARGVSLDLKGKKASIEAVTSRDAVLAIQRRSDGTIEFPHIALEKSEVPWNVAVGQVAVTGYKLTVHDRTVQPAAVHRITIASLEANELTTEDGFKGAAVARIGLDKGGALDVTSTFTLDPLVVTAKLDARKVDLVALRPYVAQFPTVALTSGAASAKGTLTLRGKLDAIRIGYVGAAEISRLATSDTTNKEDLLNWKSVRTSGIDLDLPSDGPLALAVADIVVDKVYSRLVVLPDGKLNVQQLRTGSSADPAPAAAPEEPHPRNVRIDRITFLDGRLNFTDHFIKPNYSADVGELQGTVTNLSSAPESRGVVDLKGRYDQISPVVIAGTVNPLRADLFVDIAAKGSEIELPKLTAYSQRYAGYGITGGKLTLDVKYHIENGKLEGRNKILVDQLTFGDKVESPDATKLPVLFAVNLLKDSKGQINLELPVSGSLADPQFAIGALVKQVFLNLLKKAVTSPFSLLAAALGGGAVGAGDASGGDELAFVEFDPGRSEVSAAGQKKMETLAKALQDRPGLKLELAARIDPEKDPAALKSAALQRRLVAAKRAALAASGQAPKDPDKVAIDAAEYPRYLKAVFTQEKLAKPAEKGAPHEVPVPEMEAMLLERMPVGDAELRALSLRRVEEVKGFLVQKGRLGAERVSVGTGAEAPAESKASASRVDFALR